MIIGDGAGQRSVDMPGALNLVPSARFSLDTDRLRTLEPLFHRAPSLYNSQPWRLRDAPESVEAGWVEISWDESDELGPGDPHHRDLRLSLGAFVESCLIVCADNGLALRFVADYDEASRRIGRLVGAAEQVETGFTAADVAARRTWRGRWTTEPLPADAVVELAALAAGRGGRLVTLECGDVRGLLLEASRWFVSDHKILSELRQWSRLNRRHPDYGRDGLTEVALALRWYERWLVPGALRRKRPRPHRIGLRTALARGQARAFAGEGTVLVLLAPAGTDDSGEVEFGRLMQRLWLTLTRRGFAAYPQSHLLNCPSTSNRVAELAGASDERPLWIARVGRPDPRRTARVPPSARRIRSVGDADAAAGADGQARADGQAGASPKARHETPKARRGAGKRPDAGGRCETGGQSQARGRAETEKETVDTSGGSGPRRSESSSSARHRGRHRGRHRAGR